MHLGRRDSGREAPFLPLVTMACQASRNETARASSAESQDPIRFSAASGRNTYSRHTARKGGDLKNSKHAKKLPLGRGPLTYLLFQLGRVSFAHGVYSASSKMPPNGIRSALTLPRQARRFASDVTDPVSQSIAGRFHLAILWGRLNLSIGLVFPLASSPIGLDGVRGGDSRLLSSVSSFVKLIWRFGLQLLGETGVYSLRALPGLSSSHILNEYRLWRGGPVIVLCQVFLHIATPRVPVTISDLWTPEKQGDVASVSKSLNLKKRLSVFPNDSLAILITLLPEPHLIYLAPT